MGTYLSTWGALILGGLGFLLGAVNLVRNVMISRDEKRTQLVVDALTADRRLARRTERISEVIRAAQTLHGAATLTPSERKETSPLIEDLTRIRTHNEELRQQLGQVMKKFEEGARRRSLSELEEVRRVLLTTREEAESGLERFETMQRMVELMYADVMKRSS